MQLLERCKRPDRPPQRAVRPEVRVFVCEVVTDPVENEWESSGIARSPLEGDDSGGTSDRSWGHSRTRRRGVAWQALAL